MIFFLFQVQTVIFARKVTLDGSKKTSMIQIFAFGIKNLEDFLKTRTLDFLYFWDGIFLKIQAKNRKSIPLKFFVLQNISILHVIPKIY